MRIVADTNIWYCLGQDAKLFEKVKGEPICPSFVNICELAKSDNILNNEELSRLAIQKLFAFKSNVIYEPPFIYVAQLHNGFEFDPIGEIGDWLKFTENLAKGQTIKSSKRDDFKKEIDKIRNDFKLGAEFCNQEAEMIRKRIKNKKEHKNKNTYQITIEFLNYIVEAVTNKQFNLQGFDFSQIELFVRTLDHFFKTLEISKMKFRDNDWFDLSILAYVQPGDKYWINDGKWISLIQESGCKDYLFEG